MERQGKPSKDSSARPKAAAIGEIFSAISGALNRKTALRSLRRILNARMASAMRPVSADEEDEVLLLKAEAVSAGKSVLN